MTYLGHNNDFKKSSYSLNLFKAYFCGIFAFQKLRKKCTCYSGRSSLNCRTFTKICPFLFTLMHVQVDI